MRLCVDTEMRKKSSSKIQIVLSIAAVRYLRRSFQLSTVKLSLATASVRSELEGINNKKLINLSFVK